MYRFSPWVVLVALVVATWTHDVLAAKKTVCTITVNSADEKDLLQRRLPSDQYRFVELVERGRPDWLARACRQGVRCDVLVVSGHFDGGTDFYSDRLDVRESLSVDEMEKASCSQSCPGVFAQLKEVYLFGCNTLNGDAMRSTSAAVGRSLLRAGHAPAEVAELERALNARYGESNRDRMRQIFKDVPLIYGFSSKAPLGPSAANVLERYFQAGGSVDFGSGRPSAKLLSLFAPVSMTATAGMTDADPNIAFRRDVCRLEDQRVTAAGKVDFVHDVLGRDMAEVRMFLDHLEKYAASLDSAARRAPDVAQALHAIETDHSARRRYLEFARDADEPAIRTRMMDLALKFGWLSEGQLRNELAHMIADQLAHRHIGPDDVDLACALNEAHALDAELKALDAAGAYAERMPQAAMLACLGSTRDRAAVLHALSNGNQDDLRIAQVYLGHRPIADVGEFRDVANAVLRMDGSDAQARALDTLARQPLADRETMTALVSLFARSRSVTVQRAVAGLLLRGDYRGIASAELVRGLRESRVKSPDGPDIVDVLLRRLQASG
ncbi:MAG TPA: hypothetical protein VMV45_20075 [Casimicrobiaceae bacterium]|nr:hypothetical protein [Casimicrobiaceae bacterium]